LFFLLSDRGDLLCQDFQQALQRQGYSTRVIEDLFSSASVEWRLQSERSLALCRFQDGETISDRDIHGVLLRKPSFEWSQESPAVDTIYLRAEKEAALLGWIRSLNCPVINRYPAELWFAPIDSLDYWRGRLEPFGLEPERRFLRETIKSYRVSVVGSKVIWDEGAPVSLRSVDVSLVQFARSLGLTYVEYRIADSADKPRVAAVEPFPSYREFCLSGRQEIIKELMVQLTTSENAALARTASDSWF
jgi:hypothetical protein